ncbi:MAG: UDP-N-acetylglucosamine 2-epimerase [Phycisphaerae bacterium]
MPEISAALRRNLRCINHLRSLEPEQGIIFFVGNVMIDTLLANLEQARSSPILEDLRLEPRGYAALTLHRPSNVDDRDAFERLFGAIRKIAEELPVIFPIHPRTRKNMVRFGMMEGEGAEAVGGVRLVEPLGYLDFLKLMAEARLVLTDSGGIQEETTILKVPCLTLRETTERPITVEVGSNLVVGTEPERILSGYRAIMRGDGRPPATPPLWDGHAAERIVKIMAERL